MAHHQYRFGFSGPTNCCNSLSVLQKGLASQRVDSEPPFSSPTNENLEDFPAERIEGGDVLIHVFGEIVPVDNAVELKPDTVLAAQLHGWMSGVAAVQLRFGKESAYKMNKGEDCSPGACFGGGMRSCGGQMQNCLRRHGATCKMEPGAKSMVPQSLASANIIFILGGPGAGKGTQCAKLATDLPVMHLGVGDFVRAEREALFTWCRAIDREVHPRGDRGSFGPSDGTPESSRRRAC
ncbi:conserved hypothetical protein [Coccidioides posadasii str. Silveira]|uniref:Adenylate kinase n=1 Tax=Coccidioides posadasii (strain RMSCC 757 / Silveira) TaxID=443226 RepID=E9D4D1_COCPS|nr:conserved hypothetical protein [Coccidioides posadasii str. Silveira]